MVSNSNQRYRALGRIQVVPNKQPKYRRLLRLLKSFTQCWPQDLAPTTSKRKSLATFAINRNTFSVHTLCYLATFLLNGKPSRQLFLWPCSSFTRLWWVNSGLWILVRCRNSQTFSFQAIIVLGNILIAIGKRNSGCRASLTTSASPRLCGCLHSLRFLWEVLAT